MTMRERKRLSVTSGANFETNQTKKSDWNQSLDCLYIDGVMQRDDVTPVR